MTDTITEADEDEFTNTSCSVLADVLHERTGWTRIVVGEAKFVGWVHAGVRMPNGRVLDVNGDQDEDEWMERHVAWVDAYGEDIPGWESCDFDEWVYDAPVDEPGSWLPHTEFDEHVVTRAHQLATILLSRYQEAS